MSKGVILEAKHLFKVFSSRSLGRASRELIAVDDVSFTITESPVVFALVGESGSGKSTIAKMLLDLITPSSGTILYRGKDIRSLNKNEYKTYRREVQGIFQDPFSAVNPLRRVEYIFKIQMKKLANSEQDARNLVNTVLAEVGLDENYLRKFPHQLSGGELQRLLIARAFILRPKVIIADEPVSMLDASLRATVLNIMMDMKKKYDTSFLYITHDLSTAYYIANEIIVLYRGSVVERGPSEVVVKKPKHPYTRLLVSSIPRPDPSRRWIDRVDISKMEVDAGKVRGCKFYSRCQEATEACTQKTPPLLDVGGNHLVACFLYQDENI